MEESSLPHIPDLALEKILRLLPTKAAVQTCSLSKQWQGLVCSSSRTLDFDEHDDSDRHGLSSLGSLLDVNRRRRQRFNLHKKFINFLEGYLALCIKHGLNDRLDKLRLWTSLPMKISKADNRESDIITKWLRYACQRKRGLKELDLSVDFYPTVIKHLIEIKGKLASKFYKHLYTLRLSLVSRCGQSLTSLKLEGVKIPELDHDGYDSEPLFPNLKIVFLKAVWFDNDYSSEGFLRECPSIENLSMTHSLVKYRDFDVSCCSSLKFLEVKYCDIDWVEIDPAFNLESFTFVSRSSNLEEATIILKRAFKLKRTDVCVDNKIKYFCLLGCHPSLEALIKSQGIRKFTFFNGYLSAKFSFEIPTRCFEYAEILVGELMGESATRDRSTYVTTLNSFIRSFGCCRDVCLYNNDDFRGLTIPKRTRRMLSCSSGWSTPLGDVSALEVRIPELSRRSRDECDKLRKSLRWMAPYAKLSITQVDIEAHLKEAYED